MNPQGTSFIPQRPTSGAIKKQGVKKIYILTYISFIVFFGTIVGTAGVFAYKILEGSKLAEQKKLLTVEQERFDESEMESIRELDIQMRFAEAKLESHVSLIPIFRALENSTIQTLKLDGFSYERIAAGTPTVSFTGKASGFNSVLFQREILESNDIFKDTSFVELSMSSGEAPTDTTQPTQDSDDEQDITFTIAAPVDKEFIPFTAPQVLDEMSEQALSEESNAENSEFNTSEADIVQ